MNHLPATCRIILAMTAFAMMLAGGVFVINHMGAVGGQASSHYHDQVAELSHHIPIHNVSVPHTSMPHAGEQCCHEEAGVPDCGGSCAAMAGCNLQLMPCDGPDAFVSCGAEGIAGETACRVEFMVSPATPPPKAWI